MVFLTKWIKHLVEYVAFTIVTLDNFREAALTGRVLEHSLEKSLYLLWTIFSRYASAISNLQYLISEFSKRYPDPPLTYEKKWLVELGDTFEESECQKEKEGGTIHFELELFRRFLKAILAEVPSKASLPLLTQEIESQLFIQAGKLFSMFFSHDSNPKQNKRTQCHLPEMLYELPGIQRWNVTTGPGFKASPCYYQLGCRDSWHHFSECLFPHP